MSYRWCRGSMWVVILIAFSQTKKLESFRAWINCSYCKHTNNIKLFRIFSLSFLYMKNFSFFLFCLPWQEDFCSNLSIIFRSKKLSSTAKTWNCDSVTTPIGLFCVPFLIRLILYSESCLWACKWRGSKNGGYIRKGK